MKLRRTQNPLDLSQQLITNLESRLSEQRQRIARLKMKAQPTQEAEAVLKEFESSLMQLRNHSEIMQNLTTLDRYDAPPSAEDHPPTAEKGK
jgi:hypothetical protein